MMGFKKIIGAALLVLGCSSQQICMKDECAPQMAACDQSCRDLLSKCTFECTLQSQGCMHDCSAANPLATELIKCSYEKCLNY